MKEAAFPLFVSMLRPRVESLCGFRHIESIELNRLWPTEGCCLANRRFRLYIDESGDHTYSDLGHVGQNYLGLCGIMVEMPYAKDMLIPGLDLLKRKHFKMVDPDEPVILHRNDIINRKGPFRVLRDQKARKAFDADLLKLFSRLEYKVITVVMDKGTHLQRYDQSAWHPYHYCLLALLERYCGLLAHRGDTGDVLAESRGGTEDRQLKAVYRHIHQNGSFYQEARIFQKALTSRELKLKKKKDNIAGIQVADLLAHPSKQEILKDKNILAQDGLGEYCQQIIDTIQPKYNRHLYSGRIDGYGKVFLG
jgi:hypothetical protein